MPRKKKSLSFEWQNKRRHVLSPTKLSNKATIKLLKYDHKKKRKKKINGLKKKNMLYGV